MPKRPRREYWNRRVDAEYRADLRGNSHTQLVRQRGLKGSTLGPANSGRRLTDAEKAEVAAKLRAEGKL